MRSSQGLVVTRKEGERLILQIPPSTEPRAVAFKIVDIRGSYIRVGTDAPGDVNIVCEEKLIAQNDRSYVDLLVKLERPEMIRATIELYRRTQAGITTTEIPIESVRPLSMQELSRRRDKEAAKYTDVVYSRIVPAGETDASSN